MLLRLFKGTGPGVIFLILFTLIVVWISAFLNPQIDTVFHYETDRMPLYGLLNLIIGNNHFLGLVFSFSIVSLMMFLFIHFNTNVLFINKRTYLPSLMYILIVGLFPQHQHLNPVLPASVFLMLAIKRIMDGYRKKGIAFNFFDAGILISTGSFFYANLIWFGLLVIIGIALLRTGNIREITISIIGLITPYILVSGFYYVIGKDPWDLLLMTGKNIFGSAEGYLFSQLTIIALIFTGMIILVSIAYFFRIMGTKKIKSLKTFTLLIWVFLISLVVYFALPSVSVEIVWITGIPVSYFLAHYFVFVRKKVVPEILFTLFYALILFIQIWYLK